MAKIRKRVLATILCIAIASTIIGVSDWLWIKTMAINQKTYSTGDTVKFGFFPQGEITDQGLINELNNQACEWHSLTCYAGAGESSSGHDETFGTMNPAEYGTYTDVVYHNHKYRGMILSSYRNAWTGKKLGIGTYQKKRGYEIGKTYWFKYEPIEWVILNPSLMMALNVLDAQAYSNTVYKFNNNYYSDPDRQYQVKDFAHSSLRDYLNSSFLTTAFSQNEIAQLNAHNKGTANYPITLLDQDYSNDYYHANGTDYAKMNNLFVDKNGSSGWWLNYNIYGDYEGTFYHNVWGYDDYKYASVDGSHFGVRPVIKVDINKIDFPADSIYDSMGAENSNGLTYYDDKLQKYYDDFFVHFQLETKTSDPTSKVYYQVEGQENGIEPLGPVTVEEYFGNGLYKLRIPFKTNIPGEYTISVFSTDGYSSSALTINTAIPQYFRRVTEPPVCRYGFELYETAIEKPIFEAVYGKFKGLILYTFDKELKSYGGVCYGMSVSTAIFTEHPDMLYYFNNQLKQNKLKQETCAEEYNMSVDTWIQAVQVAQRGADVKDTKDKDVQAIYELVKSSDSPIPIGASNNADAENSHRVLALGIVEGLDPDCYCIAVYDPQAPLRNCMLKISKDFKQWSLRTYGYEYTSNKADHICAATYESVQNIYKLRYNFLPISKYKSGNQYLSRNNLLVVAEQELSNNNFVNMIEKDVYKASESVIDPNSDHYLYWVDDGIKTITISPINSGSVFIADINSGIRTDLPESKEIKVTVDDSESNRINYVTTKGEPVDISFYQAEGTHIKEIAITGVAVANEIQITKKDDLIAADGLDNATITVISDEKTLDSKKVNCNNDGEIKVKCIENSIIVSDVDEKNCHISLVNFVNNRTVDYKTTITFSAETTNAPEGASIHWFRDGKDSGAGESFTVKKAKKTFTVQVKLLDKDGEVLAESEVETVTVKDTFFARLIAFFKMIFFFLPKVTQ